MRLESRTGVISILHFSFLAKCWRRERGDARARSTNRIVSAQIQAKQVCIIPLSTSARVRSSAIHLCICTFSGRCDLIKALRAAYYRTLWWTRRRKSLTPCTKHFVRGATRQKISSHLTQKVLRAWNRNCRAPGQNSYHTVEVYAFF